MNEDFLHYIWKYKRFKNPDLKTTSGKDLRIINYGQINPDSGPDIFNATIQIDSQVWVGNVEFHIDASDWYAHKHNTDKAYDNVILHVVWRYNADISRLDGSIIDTLEICKFIDLSIVDSYKSLISSKSWINCEKDFSKIDDFVLYNWLDRLYIERLEKKSELIYELLNRYNNNWEQVLFVLLFKSFGLKVNADAFESIAHSIEFNIIRKTRFSRLDLEALCLGQSNLLDQEISDTYFLELKERYHYLKHKFKLDSSGVLPLKFFRLRPSNFPTIRIAQITGLYHSTDKLFNNLVAIESMDDIYDVFSYQTSDFWQTHYNFTSSSKKRSVRLTRSFIHLITINAILPIKYVYLKSLGKFNEEGIFPLIRKIPSEKNSVVDGFNKLKPLPNNALVSQGLLQLKSNYCNANKCLSCAIGNRLLL